MTARSKPINPPQERGPRGSALPAYVSNGLIGLRLKEVPLIPGVCVVSSVVGVHPEKRVEAVARLPFPLAMDISIGEARLSEQPWAVGDLEQDYDFANGELHSRFSCILSGIRVAVSVVTFCSRTGVTLACQEVTIEVGQSADLSVCANVDTAGIRGRVVEREIGTPGEPEGVTDGSILWQTDGDLAQCGMAYWCESPTAVDKGSRRPFDDSGPLNTALQFRARRGETIVVHQLASLVPSALHRSPRQEAVRRLAEAKRQGIDDIRERNRAVWSELWRSRPLVNGGEFGRQALIDAAFFYLNTSVHASSPAGTSIFGLSFWPNYHYYFGHVMWDVDAFCVPPLTLLQPEAARALLSFRERGAQAAGMNARIQGRKGLKFPWEAGALTGEESAPGGAAAASHAAHISIHVARAFCLFASATDDAVFRAETAWPIVRGVADFICDRVTWKSGQAHFVEATGIAEVAEPPDDDAFTIMAAKEVLRRASSLARLTGHPVPDAWYKTEAGLAPIIRSDGAIPSHADFRIDEEKGSTPGPLAGLFPYDFDAGPEQRDATFKLFLDRWQDYVGSPMLPGFYSLWAARMGDRKLAAKLFEEGYAAYDSGRFHQCLEYRTDHPDSKVPAGPFFANIGAMLWSLLFGFTGLVIDDGEPDGWAKHPVVLPEGWRLIEFDRIWIHGRPARLTARHGEQRAELTWL